MSESERVPEPWGSLIDEVCDHDRAFFDAHPGQRSYTRPVVPGEFWPYAVPSEAWALVTSIAPGVRTRQPIDAPTWAGCEVLQ